MVIGSVFKRSVTISVTGQDLTDTKLVLVMCVARFVHFESIQEG